MKTLCPTTGRARSWLDCRRPSRTFTSAWIQIFLNGLRPTAEATKHASTPCFEPSFKRENASIARVLSETMHADAPLYAKVVLHYLEAETRRRDAARIHPSTEVIAMPYAEGRIFNDADSHIM